MNRKINLNNFIKYYFTFVLITVIITILIGYSIPTHLFIIDHPQHGTNFMIQVLKHNTLNFLIYFFMPFISPLMQFLDLFSSFIKIIISLRIAGVFKTANNLFPHALLEIPNFLLYQGLSEYILFSFIKNHSIFKTLSLIKKLTPVYLFSYVILIIAALLEGLKG
ncbi:MAG: hypothetical protein LBC17_01635 [Lactobacillaceae bacterium]|jgi:hypothetical protein|nr:hypothetical protein [Lactobacillaceae bacterium]